MTDTFTVRAVVLMLGLFALLGLGGLVWLVDHGVDGDQLAIIAGPTGTALGALGAVLVSTRSAGDPPQPVHITNPPAAPVPVEEVPDA